MRRSLIAASAAAFILLFAARGASAQFSSGHLFVSGWKQTIWEVDPRKWTASVFADSGDGLNGASALQYLAGSDVLLESNYYDDRIVNVDAAGTVTTRWSSSNGLKHPYGQNGLAATLGGDVYVSNYGLQQVLFFPADGSAMTIVADAADGVVHPDGISTDAFGQVWIANRDGMNVLKVDRFGRTTVFDTLPDMPMSIAIRDNGDVYVGCLYGDIYRYVDGEAAKRRLFLSFGRTLATPVLRFDLDYHQLYFTSSNRGNLLEIDPDTAKYVERLPDGTFNTPISIEVVGERSDVGLGTYGVGLGGARGMIPTLDAIGHPVFDQVTTIQIRDFVGGALALLLASDTKSDGPWMGGDSLINTDALLEIIPIQLPGPRGVPGEGDLDWAVPVPRDPALDGLVYYIQVAAFDADAPGGMSMTNGLRLVFRAF